MVILIIGLIGLHCSKQTIVDPGTEQWHYTALDSNGVTIVTGTMSFSLPDSGRFDGRWSLQTTGNPPNIGSQSGNGILVGMVNDGTVRIDLNPNRIDDNVTLLAPFQRQILQGKWMWVGLPGVINEGRFTLLGPAYED